MKIIRNGFRRIGSELTKAGVGGSCIRKNMLDQIVILFSYLSVEENSATG